MAECGAHVGKGLITYPCTLEKGHEGPCYALENGPSARQRKTWEQEHAATSATSPGVTEEQLRAAGPKVVEVDLTQRVPNQFTDVLAGALEALLDSAKTIQAVIDRRREVDGLLRQIEAALRGDAPNQEGLEALSILQAMVRA